MHRPDTALPGSAPQAAPTALASTPRVLVVGDVMLDRYWFGDVNRISPEAPVPVVQILRCEDRLGGAANVARNCVALGAHASLIGQVGQDEAGSRLSELLASAGIAAYLHVLPDEATILKLRVISRQQHLLRVDVEPSANRTASKAPASTDAVTSPESPEALLNQHDVLVLSDYAKGMLADAPDWIARARAQGRPVLVDPKGDDFSRYAGATLLTPNKAELRGVVGRWQSEAELADKAQALREYLSIDALLLTRSEEGLSLFDASGARHFPAQAREVFDVSGAGDTVIATLATMLATGVALEQAIVLANRAAGLAVARLGTTAISAAELFGSEDPLGTPQDIRRSSGCASETAGDRDDGALGSVSHSN